MRRAPLLLLPLLLGGLLAPAPAAAAEEPLKVRLTELTPWVAPEDTLHVGLSVTNPGTVAAANLRIRLQLYPAATSRFALDQALRGRGVLQDHPQGGDTLPPTAGPVTIEPGATQSIAIDKRIADFDAFRQPEDRPYPVRITVTANGGRLTSAPMDTVMIVFKRPAPIPLEVVPIVPLHLPPVYDHTGAVVPPAAQAAFADGRLDRILDGLSAHPEVPVTLAPSGLLLDTLADLSNGFARAGSAGVAGPSDPIAQRAAAKMEKLRTHARRPNARFMVMPYSGAFLPGLVHSELADRAQAQVAEGRARMVSQLGYEPLPSWVLPTAGLLDEPTLSALQRAGISQVVLAADAVRRRGARSVLTPSPVVEIGTRATDPVVGLVQDDGVAARLDNLRGELSGVQVRQRFLAETAMIMLERPAERRAIVLATPLDWSPEPEVIEGILDALGRSPWMRATTPDALLSESAARPSVEMAPPDEVLDRGPRLPAGDYFEALRSARRRIDQFADLGPPPELVTELDQKLLIAESADWWSPRSGLDRGRAFTRAIEDRVKAEFRKIRAPAAQTITLTSRAGVIPLVLDSRASYHVNVVIRLDSEKLEFPEGQRCASGGGMCISRQLEPRAQTVDLKAIARVTGRFPLRVTVMTPNEQVVIDSSRIVVRSTAYNVVGLSITAGAGMFLVAWWIVGLVRKRLPA